MKPTEFYQSLVASITDSDVRCVAQVMAQHVGQHNLITLDGLSRRAFGACNASTERKTREILERLTREHHLPVCSVSGKAGRWLAETDDERFAAARELEARAQNILDRAKALRMASVPAQPLQDRQPVQTNLWGQQ